MTDNTVMATLYSNEFVEFFEQKQSWLRGCVTTQGEVKGQTFVFIIESAADIAVERASNGLIPVADDSQTSANCTLKEYHHLARKNNFNIYSSSVPQRQSMQRRGVISLNNRTDQMIIDELETATVTAGAAAANDLAHMLLACEKLDEAFVPNDGERYGLLTPKAWAQVMKVTQWASRDYVPDQPFMKYVPWRLWNNVKWVMHPNLPGTGTSTAKCFVFHKSAIGQAVNQGDMQSKVGQNDEYDYSWARTTSYMGAKALQTAGIVQLNHDDTAAL